MRDGSSLREGNVLSGLVLDGLLVVLALFLVALNGLFVAAEFGLVKIRSTQVDGLVREGRRSSGLLKKATEKLDQYLAVCQLGSPSARSASAPWPSRP